MSAHTPGPWHLVLWNRSIERIKYQPAEVQIGVKTLRVGNGADSDADARLIAAAPDLLEALKLVLEVGLADENGAGAASDAIHAAIAKAEGSA